MHEAYLEDENGELADVVPFCSDSCNRDYMGEQYRGWSGCHEAPEQTFCAACGVDVSELVVNRFLSDEGVKRDDGTWEQVPASYLVPLVQS